VSARGVRGGDMPRSYRCRPAAVAHSVDRFLEENVSDDDARAWLDRTLPGIDGAGEATAALALDAARRRLAGSRQQLLATMVLMGVNRALDCE